jgi:hypothetical protein
VSDLLALPPLVLEDLQTIVTYALSGYALTEPEQVALDMLPGM